MSDDQATYRDLKPVLYRGYQLRKLRSGVIEVSIERRFVRTAQSLSAAKAWIDEALGILNRDTAPDV